MLKFSFFDNIQLKTKNSGWNNLCESYLFLDGISGKLGYKKVTILSSGEMIKNQMIEEKIAGKCKKYAFTAFKIVSYLTLVPLFIALSAKLYFRKSRKFKIGVDLAEKKVNSVVHHPKDDSSNVFKSDTPKIRSFEVQNETDVKGFDPKKINGIKVGYHPVYGLEIYNPKGVGLTYQIDDLFRNICQKHGVSHWLICGSVLGYERSKGRIAWDDDDDFGLFKKDEQIITSEAFQSDLKNVGLKMSKAFFGYKIYSDNQNIEYSHPLTSPDAEPHCWPFIDLFIFEETKEGKFEYENPRARELWPDEYFLKEELFNKEGELDVRQYGPIKTTVPHETSSYLKRVYGADCMTHGRMGWDVENGRPHAKTKVELTDFDPSYYVFDSRYPRPSP